MRAKHLSKFLGLLSICVMFLGYGVFGESEVEEVSTESLVVEEADQEIEADKPWENVFISDVTLKNEKLNYYKRLPEEPKVIGHGKLIKLYQQEVPENVTFNLQYTQYDVSNDYFLNLGAVVNVREKPLFKAKIRVKKYRYQRMNVDAVIQGEYSNKAKSDLWYRVYWDDKNGVRQYGYIFAPVVEKREFQLDKMIHAANLLKEEVDHHQTAYISNYKNRNGWAPRYEGKVVDAYGVKRDQSVPAYFQEGDETEFRYMPDGTLISLQGESEAYYQITAMGYEGMYFVPKKYVSLKTPINRLEKLVVVDRHNQNEIVLEHDGTHWTIVSQMLATTGVEAEHKEETELGYFMVVEKKSKFLYLDDITEEISGYAPYALRFNGGAYVHGVPVNYKLVKETHILQPAVLDDFGNIITPEVTEEVIVDRVDPGHAEYLSTIGTTPRSHKCVRNYTSHAKFLYEWAEVGKTAVIVIE